jgi:hypothetical protein
MAPTCHHTDNALAVEMAEARAGALGYSTLVLTTLMEGEAREVAKLLSSIAREVPLSGRPIKPPCCIIVGGETTVTLRGVSRRAVQCDRPAAVLPPLPARPAYGPSPPSLRPPCLVRERGQDGAG